MQFGSFDQHAQAAFSGHDEVGVKHYVGKVGTNSRVMLGNDKRVKNLWLTVAEAYAALESNQCDMLIIPPESHSLAETLVWAKNNCVMTGMKKGSRMNIRNRIGMSTAFTPMITVSGYGNTFKDIYTMHGTAAGDYIGWLISGERNYFNRVHFGGPMNAAQGGHASYEGVAIDGSENTFDDCVFGTDTIARDEVSPNVTLGPATKTLFRNCTFMCNLADGDPIFIKAENSSGNTWAYFENCKFFAFNSNYATPMTVAVDSTAAASCALVFDINCMFQNVTIIADATTDAYVHIPRTHNTTTDSEGLVGAVLTA